MDEKGRGVKGGDHRVKNIDDLIENLGDDESNDHNQKKNEEREGVLLTDLLLDTVGTVCTAEKEERVNKNSREGLTLRTHQHFRCLGHHCKRFCWRKEGKGEVNERSLGEEGDSQVA
jgi:hypothetical protein